VAVCDTAYEELGARHDQVHWSVPDPVIDGTNAAFERAYRDLQERVGRLATAVVGVDDRPRPSGGPQ